MPYLTTRKNLKLQLSPGLVASYDIQPGNGVGLFWETKHAHILTYLLTFSGPTRGNKKNNSQRQAYYSYDRERAAVTSEKRLMKRFPLRRMMLNARQQRSMKCWKRSPALSPPLITYAMSDVRTNGVRSLTTPTL